MLASSAARAGAGRDRKPNSGGGARTKGTRNGTAGIVASTGTVWQKPAAEFRRLWLHGKSPGRPVFAPNEHGAAGMHRRMEVSDSISSSETVKSEYSTKFSGHTCLRKGRFVRKENRF